MQSILLTYRKWLFVLAIGLLILGSLAGCGGQAKVLKIGYVTEQTGQEAYIGQASIPALKDHVDKINAAGGIGG